MIYTLTTLCEEGDEVEDVKFSGTLHDFGFANDEDVVINPVVNYTVAGIQIKDEEGFAVLYEMPLRDKKTVIAGDILTFPAGAITVDII